MKVDLQDVIVALQESQNDPDAATRQLRRDADQREAEAEGLRRLADAIDLLRSDRATAAVVVTTDPDTDHVPPGHEIGRTLSTPERPAGIEAIRRVMREGGVWTAKELLEELTRRGWEPENAKHPQAATEAALNRLWKVKGELDRVARGQYRYKGLPASPASAMDLGSFARGGGDT